MSKVKGMHVRFYHCDIGLSRTNREFDKLFHKAKSSDLPNQFAIVYDDRPRFATDDANWIDINNDGSLDKFKLENQQGYFKVRFTGLGEDGSRCGTCNVQRAVQLNDVRLAIVEDGCVWSPDEYDDEKDRPNAPAAAAPIKNGPGWFDPKLPKRIDII
jgi:hypothetical protein